MTGRESTEPSWWSCPIRKCQHGSVLHDGDGVDEGWRCCVDGCFCGHTKPLDPAQIMSEHRAYKPVNGQPRCARCDKYAPCEPYQLAEALAEAEQMREALAEAERIRDAHKRHLDDLRDETLRSKQLQALHESAKAYVDVCNAYAEMYPGPLSTTIGYLIRAGFLVRSDVGTHELLLDAKEQGRQAGRDEVLTAVDTYSAEVSRLRRKDLHERLTPFRAVQPKRAGEGLR